VGLVEVPVSKFNPTYDTFFRAGEDGVTHSDATGLPVSDASFVAFKFSVSDIYDMTNPVITVSVTVTSTNLLGNELGMLGLYEMSDSNWIGSDPYDSVDEKVDISPIAISKPIADHDCDGQVDAEPGSGYESNPVTFTIPDSVVKRWKRRNMSQVSLAVDTYRDFESDGVMTIGSNESGTPIEIEIKEGTTPVPGPLTVNVTPTTITPAGRATITIADSGRSFDAGFSDIVVTVDGERATILSGSEKSLKISVPDIPDKIEGACEVLLSDMDGVAISNPCRAYYDASATRRNKIFAEPSRPGRENDRVSHSAVYNRDIGFNNFVEITDENSLVQNIYNILLTRKGERLFNPNFGTTIEERVFSIMNADDEVSILQECFTAIREYEPRVTVDYDESRVDVDYDSNTIRIIIAVVLPNGNSEYIVLPFKSRGTLVR
jgi:phage baseplate assembly protein W